MPIAMLGLDQLATVYAEDPVTGEWTVVVKENLRCRLAHINLRRLAGASFERAELENRRNMLWDPDFVMNEHSQFEVEGVRHNPVAGTFSAYRGPSSTVIYRRCDSVRADDAPSVP